MARVIWKGAIAFGLVNIPVIVRPATKSHTIDLDLLDARDMAPVGYQRINKSTGKPVDAKDIVKGYEYEKGEYVLLNDEDFRQANVEATQTVDIVSFVEAESIPPYYFDTPYYLEPDKRGERGYALLRETMRKSGRAALALVVLRARQHLAALLVWDDALVLNTMRFADEVLDTGDLALPKATKSAKSGPSPREVEMATRLVEDMSEDFAPAKYHDTYREDLLKRIDEKVESGKTHQLTPVSEETGEAPSRGAKVIDMVALLKKSLEGRGGKAAKGEAANDEEETEAEGEDEEKPRHPARKTARKSARKSASKSATKTATRKTAARKAPAKHATAKRKSA